MRTTIQHTARELAEIAELSPGYSVDITEAGKVYSLSEIRFARHARSGRRNRAVMECTCNGKPGRFDSDTIFDVLD
jgi:hypothetical protein